MRDRVRWALPVSFFVLIASSVMMSGVPAASAADGSSINVTPNTDLRDRTTVVASGTIGQAAQASLVVICLNGITSDPANPQNYCDRTPTFLPSNTSGGVAYSKSFEAKRTITASDGVHTADCDRPATCVVVLFTFNNTGGALRASAPISFSNAAIDDAGGDGGPSGGTITTFRSSQHQTATDPIGSSLTTAVDGGPLSLNEQAIAGSAPAGYTYLGQDVVATAPAAMPSTSSRLTINVDLSVVPAGESEQTLQLFRDGVPVRDCSRPTHGSTTNRDVPDPCVSSRTVDQAFNGSPTPPMFTKVGYLFTLDAADVSATWNVGTGPLQPPADTITLTPDDSYVDGQSVAVAGTIQTPFARGIPALCSPAVIDAPADTEALCSTQGSTPDVNSPGDFSYSGHVVMHRSLTTIDGSAISCGNGGDAATTCVVAYITGSTAAEFAVRVYTAVSVVPAPVNDVSESVGAGGSASTHPDAGQNAEDTQGTTVTSPNGGTVTIDEAPRTGAPPTGYWFIGQQTTIGAPAASGAVPLRLSFFLDVSVIPTNETADSLVIFRDGVPIDTCANSSGTADPDPCVVSRQTLSGGDIQIDVLSSHASVWNIGTTKAPK